MVSKTKIRNVSAHIKIFTNLIGHKKYEIRFHGLVSIIKPLKL